MKSNFDNLKINDNYHMRFGLYMWKQRQDDFQ